jgi:hypothetical protein
VTFDQIAAELNVSRTVPRLDKSATAVASFSTDAT